MKARFIALFILVFIPFVFSLDDKFKEILKVIHAYTEKNIVPVMKIQRKKLDTYLSFQDRKEVEKLQQQYTKLNARKENRTRRYTGKPDLLMQEWELIQRENKRIWENASEIADKYEKKIDLLFAEVSTQRNVWRSEMDFLIDKYNLNLDENHIRLLKKFGFGEFMQPAGFILWKWDPPQENEAGAEERD